MNFGFLLSAYGNWYCSIESEGLKIAADLSAWIAQAVNVAPVKEAPVTSDVALAILRVRLPHDDPADQFLVATAAFGLTLATADRHLVRAEGISVLAN